MNVFVAKLMPFSVEWQLSQESLVVKWFGVLPRKAEVPPAKTVLL